MLIDTPEARSAVENLRFQKLESRTGLTRWVPDFQVQLVRIPGAWTGGIQTADSGAKFCEIHADEHIRALIVTFERRVRAEIPELVELRSPLINSRLRMSVLRGVSLHDLERRHPVETVERGDRIVPIVTLSAWRNNNLCGISCRLIAALVQKPQLFVYEEDLDYEQEEDEIPLAEEIKEEPVRAKPEIEEDECRVCRESTISTVCIPCGHFGMCRGCADLIMTTTRSCPFCRTEVTAMRPWESTGALRLFVV